MKLFGVTGGIAMGKTTAGEILRRRGVPVVDTDVVAREIVEPGQPALDEIRAKFGGDVFHSDGRLDRAALAERIFGSATERAALEAILHPRIRAAWQAEVETWRATGMKKGAVIIPLLFETNANNLFDSIVCVACSAPTQAQRLRARGLDDREGRERVAAQAAVEKKMGQAHFVVWTDTTMEAHEAQWGKILAATN